MCEDLCGLVERLSCLKILGCGWCVAKERMMGDYIPESGCVIVAVQMWLETSSLCDSPLVHDAVRLLCAKARIIEVSIEVVRPLRHCVCHSASLSRKWSGTL
jgi:hypothetical protein